MSEGAETVRLKSMLCLCLCLVMALAGPALASARLPVQRGAATDDADVLSAQTVSDFSSYAQQVEAETDLRLHVALVHFWDGLDAQAYADALFEAWNLGDMDILLCGAAGEDAFAAAMGDGAADLLGRQSAENLMYTSSRFGTLFASQQYDAALAEYCRAFNALVLKRTDADISLDGLFGTAQATPAPTSESRLWDEVMDAINDSSEAYQARHDSRRYTENGLSAGGWIVLAVLVLIVLKSGRRRRTGPVRSGCGCSPLGWLFSLLGLNVLIDMFRRRS